jgi:hypothetical protein
MATGAIRNSPYYLVNKYLRVNWLQQAAQIFDNTWLVYSNYSGRIVLINKVVVEGIAFKYFTITLRALSFDFAQETATNKTI